MKRIRSTFLPLLLLLSLAAFFAGCGGSGGTYSDPNVTAGSQNFEVRDFAPLGGSHTAVADTFEVTGGITYSPAGSASSSNTAIKAGPLAIQ